MSTSAPTATRTTPPPALLHGIGDRAVAWLHAERDRFRLTEDDMATGLALGTRLKPIGELAVNMQVLFREGVAGSRQHTRAEQLLDFAWRELLDGGRVLARLQYDEPLSPVPLEVYAPFRWLGHHHPGLEAAVAVNRRTVSWRAVEAVPNRCLSRLNAERRLGLAPSEDLARATARTWLGQRPEPWAVGLHVAYDITHTVFHLTDWGAHPEWLPPELADYLQRYLPAWIRDWAELEHWDLLGELLTTDACLPEPALDAAAWELYAAAQLPSGAMPVHGYGEPAGDAEEVFDQLHHPTLVAAFASAMATSRLLGGTGSGGAA